VPEGTTPPQGAGPTLAAPWWRVGSSEPASDPVSSCTVLLLYNSLLYIHPGLPRSVYRVFVEFCFRAVLTGISNPYMASRGVYGEKYAARRRRELERDVDEGTFVGWATEEEIAARRADMD